MVNKSKNNLSAEIQETLPFEPNKTQHNLIDKLCEYLISNELNSVFVLNGYAGTGKTSILGAVARTILKNKTKIHLMAPTGRAAKVLSFNSGLQAYTIHRSIYNASEEYTFNSFFTLKNNTFKNTVFIADEASMIGEKSSDEFQNLLQDLLMFVFQGENCKLILSGDVAQLPPVGYKKSPALNPDYLESEYGVKTSRFSLNEVMRQKDSSGILFNATAIRLNLIQNIKNNTNQYPKFVFDSFSDITLTDSQNLSEMLEQSYQRNGREETIVICRSNHRANVYNSEIRNRIFHSESDLVTGELLMVVKNNYFWYSNKNNTDFIANGEIIKIKRIRKTYELYHTKFAEVTIQLSDRENEPELDVVLNLGALNSKNASLSSEEYRKLYELVAADYEHINKKSKRLLEIRKDKHLNALQVKYAYAVTCHKSQGGQWNHVYVDKGILPEDLDINEYHRWLYTAVTRAKEKLFLIGFDDNFFN